MTFLHHNDSSPLPAPLLIGGTRLTRPLMWIGVVLGLVESTGLVVLVASNLEAFSRMLEPLNLGGSGWTTLHIQVAAYQSNLGSRLSLHGVVRDKR